MNSYIISGTLYSVMPRPVVDIDFGRGSLSPVLRQHNHQNGNVAEGMAQQNVPLANDRSSAPQVISATDDRQPVPIGIHLSEPNEWYPMAPHEVYLAIEQGPPLARIQEAQGVAALAELVSIDDHHAEGNGDSSNNRSARPGESEKQFTSTWVAGSVSTLIGDNRVTDSDELAFERLNQQRWGRKVGIEVFEIKGKRDLEKIPNINSKFVLNTDGSLFVMVADPEIFRNNDGISNIITHSGMSTSPTGEVVSAGYICRNGEQFEITNVSGHYTPPEISLYYAAEKLNKLGCDNLKIKPFIPANPK